MTSVTRDLFRGSLVVARRDFLANVRSVKFVVLSILVLLVMLGAAFGLSGFAPIGPGIQNEYSAWTFAVYPGNNSSSANALVRVTNYAGTPHAGLAIDLGYPYSPADPNPTFQLYASNLTDADGWAGFRSLAPGLWPLRYVVGQTTFTSSVDVLGPSSSNFTASWHPFDVIGDGSFRDYSAQAIRWDGMPLAGAVVSVNGTASAALDAQGFHRLRLDPGVWVLNVTYGGETQTSTVIVRQPIVITPFLQGPDFILYFVAFALMGLFAPIVAIALSYDALTKERLQGSLELLLVRPATRTGLAVGKFLGTFASVGTPILGVSIAALGAVALLTGKWPDLLFDAAFILGTLALIATYVLLMQIFSTVARSPGTAILSAILVWFVFNLLWNLIFVLVSAMFHIEGGTSEAFALSTATLLFNPTGVYQLTLSAAFPPSLEALAGSYQLPDWTGPAAFVVWIAVLLVIAVLAFKKKIV